VSTDAPQRGTGESEPVKSEVDSAPPLDPDRPFVDGTTATPEELRAEVERLRTGTEEQQHVAELREEVGESVAELAARLDVKSRVTEKVTEKKGEAVATVHEQVDRARTVMAEGATAARQKPGMLGAVVAALLALIALVVAVRRRRG
jgi:phage-related minor tail protein